MLKKKPKIIKLVFVPQPFQYRVLVRGEFVGMVREVSEGFQYFAGNVGTGGEVRKTLYQLEKDLNKTLV